MKALTRRETLTLVGGALLAGRSAGAVAAWTNNRRRTTTVRAFVGSYHWGFFLLNESGRELDQLTLSSGDELHLTAFNVEADEAVAELPALVRASILSAAERAQRNRESIPVQQGASLDSLHEAAEQAYPDHSLAILGDDYLVRTPSGRHGPGGQGPSGGQHGPGHHMGPYGPGGHGPWWGDDFTGMLVPPTYLWHHATLPSEIGFTVKANGSFGFACTVYCGYGHPYMAERGRIVVESG